VNTDFIASILQLLAPSVAEKVITYLKDKKLDSDDLNFILIAQLIEQNNRTLQCLNGLNETLVGLSEDIAIIKHRTEALAKKNGRSKPYG